MTVIGASMACPHRQNKGVLVRWALIQQYRDVPTCGLGRDQIQFRVDLARRHSNRADADVACR